MTSPAPVRNKDLNGLSFVELAFTAAIIIKIMKSINYPNVTI